MGIESNSVSWEIRDKWRHRCRLRGQTFQKVSSWRIRETCSGRREVSDLVQFYFVSWAICEHVKKNNSEMDPTDCDNLKN